MNFDEYCSTKIVGERDSENFENEYKVPKKQQNNAKKQQNFEKNSQNSKFSETELKEKIDQYKSKDSNQLLDELIKETAKQKKNGTLDDNKLSTIGESLKPMLDKSQQEKLEQILKMLR